MERRELHQNKQVKITINFSNSLMKYLSKHEILLNTINICKIGLIIYIQCNMVYIFIYQNKIINLLMYEKYKI